MSQEDRCSKDCCQTEKGLRFLVIDDDSVSGLILGMILENLGFEYHICTGGLDALKILSQESFDLIFLDAFMPGLNGFETSLKIRELSGHEKTPILMTTGGAPISQEDLRAAKIDEILFKPYRIEELQVLIHKLLPSYCKTNKDLLAFLTLFEKQQKPLILLARAFLSQKKDLQILYELLETGKTKQAADLLHKFKGTFANMGLTDLSSGFLQLENKILAANFSKKEDFDPLFCRIHCFSLSLERKIKELCVVESKILTKELLEQTKKMLEEGDPSVLEIFEEINHQAQPSSFYEFLNSLREFDFERSQQILQSTQNEWKFV